MIIRENGYYTNRYRLWERKLNQPYDYANDGLLSKILSHKIYESDNPFLKYILDVYEKSLIYGMRYIDLLANFINYNWKNR